MKNLLPYNPLRPLYAVFALLFIILACSTIARPTGQPFLSEPVPNGLIAYLGSDGNLYVIDENGGNKIPVTQNVQNEVPMQIYQNPTWSQDGGHLAFVAVKAHEESQASRLLVFTPETGETTEIFSDSAESPFYVYWSPDNESVSFLTSVANSNSPHLSLRLAFLNGEASRIADTGQPYFWVWAPNGKQFFVHKGGLKIYNPDARLSLFSPNEDHMETFELAPANFQTPAWSPDGKQLLVAIVEDRHNELALLDLNGTKIQTFAEFTTNISFSWSPNGEHIAYLAANQESNGFLSPLTILATENPDQRQTTSEETVLAYFWARDSQKIAYVTLDTSEDVEASLIRTQLQKTLKLSLNVMEVQTGVTHHLITFQPTDDFLSILPVFDQYHHSATIWSPDSTKLVYTALGGEQDAQVWVISANGGAPVQLADGTLAFWSWK